MRMPTFTLYTRTVCGSAEYKHSVRGGMQHTMQSIWRKRAADRLLRAYFLCATWRSFTCDYFNYPYPCDRNDARVVNFQNVHTNFDSR